MPKVYDKGAGAKKRQLADQPVLGRQALSQSLRGLSYEAGAAAIGMDPQQLGEDPQDMGLDPHTLIEDLETILKDLQPCYDPFYLRADDMARAVSSAYGPGGDASVKGTADGRFNIALNELVLKIVDICRNTEFAKQSDLTSRMRMTKEQKRQHAEKAARLLAELQRVIAAMAYMAAQVSKSPESTRLMQIAMMRIIETRSIIEWQQRTFRSEGLQIGPSKQKSPDAPPEI